jgi:hypothetical protein
MCEEPYPAVTTHHNHTGGDCRLLLPFCWGAGVPVQLPFLLLLLLLLLMLGLGVTRSSRYISPSRPRYCQGTSLRRAAQDGTARLR